MFYDNLKAECKRQRLKVCPTVVECGGSTGQLANWKRGSYPNSAIVMKLAQRLNVTTDYLLFGEMSELTSKEYKIIKAYRKEIEAQKYVDRILNIEHEDYVGGTVCISISDVNINGEEKKYE